MGNNIKVVDTSLDLSRNQLINAVLHKASSDPGSAIEGQVYYNTGSHLLKVRLASTWSEVASKSYVDAVKQGLFTKDAVRVASTANVDIADAPTDIDGVTLSSGDRVLLKSQSVNTQNGIYVFNGASSALTRSDDADTGEKLKSGSYVFVQEGTANADAGYVLTTDGAITIGASALTWSQFSGAGQISAGDGLTKTGNTLNVVGTSGRILVNADSIDIASTYVGQTSLTTLGTISTGTWQADKVAIAYGGTNADAFTTNKILYFDGTKIASSSTDYSSVARKTAALIGDGSNTSFSVTHNFGTKDVSVVVYDTTDDEDVEVEVSRSDTNTVSVTFASTPALNAYRVVVIG